ncbi:hypothetical protein EXIGLDRAFT_580294, partial [Exidia glandulosa HHB12029]
IQGVKRLSNGNIRIRTTSEDVQTALVIEPDAWLPALATGAQLQRDSFTVEVRAVPTTFDPSEACAIQAIYQANAHVFPSAASIVSLRWLRELKSDKRTSSLLLVLDDTQTFSRVVYSGVSVHGRQCDVSPHVPSPVQCFFCQAWGHTTSTCPRKQEHSTIICARCAGPHATSAC